MLFSEMTTFVRTVADTDAEDAPDSVLSVYAQDAYYDIRRRVNTWPHLRTDHTLTVTASEPEYDLTASVEFVESVIGDTWKLEFVDRDTLERFYEGTSIVSETREADMWNHESGVLKLYPVPSDSSVTYTVRGYRPFADFPVSNNAPDLPVEFHTAICYYMLAKFYMSQEDIELAERHMADYERRVQRALAGMLRSSAGTARPLIFGGSRFTAPGYAGWMKRNTEG